jgi:hypothetical protein
VTALDGALERGRVTVAEALRELYGDAVAVDAERGAFGFRAGSAWVNVWVRPGDAGMPTVTIRAWLVEGTELSPEFLRHLLGDDQRPPFGSFGLDERDVVFVEERLPGDGITTSQLRTAVATLAEFADRADDAIVARFGGIRMTDRRPSGAGGT